MTETRKKGILAIIIGIALIFVMTACDDDTGDTTLTYKGTSGDNEWVLKITGSSYELSNGLNTSKGSVNKKDGTTYYLKPSVTATLFTATVTSSGLTELQGTIVWYPGGQPDALPGQLNPTGGTGGGKGGGNDNPVGPVGNEPDVVGTE